MHRDAARQHATPQIALRPIFTRQGRHGTYAAMLNVWSAAIPLLHSKGEDNLTFVIFLR